MIPHRHAGTFDTLAERVLQAVEQVPTGSVVSYGDIAEIVGTTPRIVGSVMSQYGSGVPWWRVTNRDGQLPEHLLEEARRHWADEGIAAGEGGCRIRDHRADLDEVAARYEDAIAAIGVDPIQPGTTIAPS